MDDEKEETLEQYMNRIGEQEKILGGDYNIAKYSEEEEV